MKKIFGIILLLCLGKGVDAQEVHPIYSHLCGKVEITLLQEMAKNDKPDVLVDITDEIINQYATNGTFPGAVNVFLVRIEETNILVDAGFGSKLFAHLDTLGVAAEEINVVLITHLHGDHIGGMLRKGKIAFPNAIVYISQREHDYWAQSDNKGARAFLEAYKKQIRLFDPNELNTQKPVEIIPGVRPFAAYGHTPGHTVYQFGDSTGQILVIGDVINIAPVQFPCPHIAAIYDIDKEEASRTKVNILRYAATNNIPIAGMHLSFPAMGTISEKDNGFEFKLIE